MNILKTSAIESNLSCRTKIKSLQDNNSLFTFYYKKNAKPRSTCKNITFLNYIFKGKRAFVN